MKRDRVSSCDSSYNRSSVCVTQNSTSYFSIILSFVCFMSRCSEYYKAIPHRLKKFLKNHFLYLYQVLSSLFERSSFLHYNRKFVFNRADSSMTRAAHSKARARAGAVKTQPMSRFSSMLTILYTRIVECCSRRVH